ncbi:MAG: magnesium transporter CorA family protein [Bacteroidetes bacterium]|nr:magnesium transporter CorA family protein [Bacteroidota bacterium]
MVTFWKQTDGSFQQIQSIEENCLIKVVAPDSNEFDFLVNELKLDIDLIHDILDIDEVARIDKENGTTAIIMRIPLFTPTEEIPFRTIPLGIILHQGHLLTICLHDSAILDDILTNRIRNVSLSNFTDYILNIFNRSAYYFLKHLKEINRRTYVVERNLRKSVENSALIELLAMEKSLVYFTTSLQGNQYLLDKFPRLSQLYLDAEETDFLEEVQNDIKQALEMGNIYSNILSGMMDAFASVISNNLNVVIKQLTFISLILMIPTLIVSTYGMNINLPFQEAPYAFALIMGVSITISVIGILMFRKASISIKRVSRKFFSSNKVEVNKEG